MLHLLNKHYKCLYKFYNISLIWISRTAAQVSPAPLTKLWVSTGLQEVRL